MKSKGAHAFYSSAGINNMNGFRVKPTFTFTGGGQFAPLYITACFGSLGERAAKRDVPRWNARSQNSGTCCLFCLPSIQTTLCLAMLSSFARQVTTRLIGESTSSTAILFYYHLFNNCGSNMTDTWKEPRFRLIKPWCPKQQRMEDHSVPG